MINERNLYKNARLTLSLAAANIIIYLITLKTKLNIADLAFYGPYVRAGEWYRLVTSVFAHISTEHLFSNMLSLVIVGAYIEMLYGRARYILIYVISGIAGNLISYAAEVLRGGEYRLSLGASGAISGLVGAFIVYILLSRDDKIPIKNIILAVACIVLPGIGTGSVNIAAHVGGLAAGAIVAYLTIRKTLV